MTGKHFLELLIEMLDLLRDDYTVGRLRVIAKQLLAEQEEEE